MTLVFAIILALLLVGTFPIWPHSISWGYYPASGAGVLLAVLVLYAALR